MYTYIHEMIINGKEAMNVKESQEGIVGGFGHKKWKGKMLQFYYQKLKPRKKKNAYEKSLTKTLSQEKGV